MSDAGAGPSRHAMIERLGAFGAVTAMAAAFKDHAAALLALALPLPGSLLPFFTPVLRYAGRASSNMGFGQGGINKWITG